MMSKRAARLAYAATLGGIAFVVAFVLGTPLNVTLGPAMGGLANAVVTAMIVALGCRGVERFPYATVVWLAFSVPAVFTPTMGPPGPHKVLIALVTGLTMEALFWLFGRARWSYAAVGFAMSVVMTLGILGSIFAFGLDLATGEALLARLSFILPVYGVLGAVGMYLGTRVFDSRIRDTDFVRRL